MSRLRSSYLLGLIGHCSEGGHRLLVYEFMANGCLQEHLYPNGGMAIFITSNMYVLVHLMCTDHERCLTLLLKSHNLETPEYGSYLAESISLVLVCIGFGWHNLRIPELVHVGT